MDRCDIVVIGASAGGLAVLRKICAGLPADFPGVVLVVQHVGAHRSMLAELLDSAGPLPVRIASAGAPMRPGCVLVAPPDQHLLVEPGLRVRLHRGPKENHARPAVDPLFRSAAIAYGPRVVGVVLSGYLDDGTAGLQAIKACGGHAIVQDPADAEQPGMPSNAQAHVAVDAVLPGDAIAAQLARLARQAARPAGPPPDALVREQRISNGTSEDTMADLDRIGSPDRIICPDCGGVLWRLGGSAGPTRFRCHTGHAFTLQSLAHEQATRADEAVWRALRAVHERERLLRMLARSLEEVSREEAQRLLREAEHSATHARQLLSIATAGAGEHELPRLAAHGRATDTGWTP